MAFRFAVFCAVALLIQNAYGAIIPAANQVSLPGSQLVSAIPASSSSASSSASSSSITSGFGNGLALPASNLALGNNLSGCNNGLASGYGSGVALSSRNLAGYGSGIASAYGSSLASSTSNLAGYGPSAGPLGFNNNLINSGSALFIEQPNYLAQQQPSVLIAQQPTVFTVVSGSPVYDIPCGITISSENELSGAVSVTGTIPFAGSSWFEGSVASEGAAALNYAAGSGTGLYNVGCGIGLGGSNGVVFQSSQDTPAIACL